MTGTRAAPTYILTILFETKHSLRLDQAYNTYRTQTLQSLDNLPLPPSSFLHPIVPFTASFNTVPFSVLSSAPSGNVYKRMTLRFLCLQTAYNAQLFITLPCLQHFLSLHPPTQPIERASQPSSLPATCPSLAGKGNQPTFPIRPQIVQLTEV